MAARFWRQRSTITLVFPALGTIFAAAHLEHGKEKTEKPERRILIIGKTGNGKSSLGNTILGERRFDVGSSMSSTTLRAQSAEAVGTNFVVKVVDTPDPVNAELSSGQFEAEIRKWKQMTPPAPSAILLAVRCDVRYTAEEYDIYKKIKATWADNSFKNVLVVAFTFGDRQDKDLGDELKTVCPELKSVLKDASGRYVLFNNVESKEEVMEQVGKLHALIDDLDKTSPAIESSEEKTDHTKFTAPKIGAAILGCGLLAWLLQKLR